MPISADIYSQFAPKPVSPQDVQNGLMQQALVGAKMQESQMALRQSQAVEQQRNGLRQAVQSGQLDLSNPEHQNQALAQFPDVAPPLLEQVSKRKAQESQTNLHNAQAKEADGKVAAQKLEMASRDWAGIDPTSDEQMASVIAKHVKNGFLDQGEAEALAAKLQGMTPDQRTREYYNLGLKGLDMKERVAQQQKVAEEAGRNQRSAAEITGRAQTNAATNATHLQGIGIQQAGENARHGQTMANQRLVAGLAEDGTPTNDEDATVKAIGEYRMKPPTLQALRNPRIAAMMDRVNAQYPGFDATQYDSRQSSVKSFATGKDGQAVQSANTALNHLDSLRELAAAQKNGDVRLINDIKNRIAKEFGGVAPANLQAAVTLVGPEISKAVIGAGGGQGDREKVDAALAALVKGGPAQAEGTLATMEDLFGGRLTEAKRTYERTTRQTDFESSLLSPAAQKILARKSSARTIKRTGVDADGKKVIEYSDGKIEHAN